MCACSAASVTIVDGLKAAEPKQKYPLCREVATCLLITEVNAKTMCELGSGGVSLVSMARRTLGSAGVQIACWSFILIHYALLVAYVARSSDILTNFLEIPLWESATLFSFVLGGICYFESQRFTLSYMTKGNCLLKGSLPPLVRVLKEMENQDMENLN